MDSAEHLDDRAWRPGSDGEHQLQRRLGTVDRADRFYDDQVLDHLNVRMREFIDRQEMFFLATSDRHGECDSTFRAGPPGFLRVLDARTLAYPEYRGNGVLASLGNIQENPHLGILMVDFFRDRIGLHVNGRARVVEDAEMRETHPGLPVDPVPGRRAVVWVEVTIEEAYIHCAKHIPHLQKVPPQRRTAGGDARRRGLTGDQALEHDRERDWGTDDVKRKGGDFFGAAAEAREGRRTPPRSPAPPSRPAPPASSLPPAPPAPPVPPAMPAPRAPLASRPVDLPGGQAAPDAQATQAVPGLQGPADSGLKTLGVPGPLTPSAAPGVPAAPALSGAQTHPAAPAFSGSQAPAAPAAPVAPGPHETSPVASAFSGPEASAVPAAPAVSGPQGPAVSAAPAVAGAPGLVVQGPQTLSVPPAASRAEPAVLVGPGPQALATPAAPTALVVPGPRSLATPAAPDPEAPTTAASSVAPGTEAPAAQPVPAVPGPEAAAIPTAPAVSDPGTAAIPAAPGPEAVAVPTAPAVPGPAAFAGPPAPAVPGPEAVAIPAAPRAPGPQTPPAAQAGSVEATRRGPEPTVARADLSPAIRPPVRPEVGPESWREEAERVLAEARQRAARKTQQPFSGWFR